MQSPTPHTPPSIQRNQRGVIITKIELSQTAGWFHLTSTHKCTETKIYLSFIQDIQATANQKPKSLVKSEDKYRRIIFGIFGRLSQ